MKSQKTEEILKAIEAYSKKITKSRDAARSALHKEGIYTRNGKISRKYKIEKSG